MNKYSIGYQNNTIQSYYFDGQWVIISNIWLFSAIFHDTPHGEKVNVMDFAHISFLSNPDGISQLFCLLVVWSSCWSGKAVQTVKRAREQSFGTSVGRRSHWLDGKHLQFQKILREERIRHCSKITVPSTKSRSQKKITVPKIKSRSQK